MSDTPRYPFADLVYAREWECASHEVHAAPGRVIFVHGFSIGKRQTLRIDAEEIDELTRRLHEAKRLARSEAPDGE